MFLRIRSYLKGLRWKLRAFLIIVLITAFTIILRYEQSNKVGNAIKQLLGFDNNEETIEDRLRIRPGYLIYTSGCKIPEWDPYDSSIKHLIEEIKEPYKCPGRPTFLKVKFNATITVDEDILKTYYGLTKDNISCTYRSISRNPVNAGWQADRIIKFGNATNLQFNVPLKEEFLEITCSMENQSQFVDYAALVALKPDVEMRAEKALKEITADETLNINLIALDSISKLNFLRHFPKCHRFIKENFSPIELKGYTKVADNTFVNIVPLLTGHFVQHFWNESMKGFYFDDVNIIWKNYSRRGYRTLYGEDMPNFGTFNYLTNGFVHPPTDYYLRPFILAVDNSKMKEKSKTFCYQSKVEMDVYYNYLTDFVQAMGHRPFFAFTFTSRFSHDMLNFAGFEDEPTYNLFRNLSDSGVLNRSLTIFFSDHGLRFGPILKTYIGKTEERMPFIFLLFPSWFLEKYPKITKNLKINERRLTTPFDIHATLVHLLNFRGDLTNHVPSPLLTPHGISLFTEIPESRTCSDAAILPHWCTCHTYTAVVKTDIKVIKAARTLIDTINSYLKPHSDKCAFLHLDDIIDARIGEQSEQVMRYVRRENIVINHTVVYGDKLEGPLDYLLTVSVFPGGGMFEATVRFQNSTGVYKVLDDIGRINRYGHQSKCLKNSRVQKYCYCKNLMKEINKENSNSSNV